MKIQIGFLTVVLSVLIVWSTSGIRAQDFEQEEISFSYQEFFDEGGAEPKDTDYNLCNDPFHTVYQDLGCDDPVWDAECKTKGGVGCGAMTPATCTDLVDPIVCCAAKRRNCIDNCIRKFPLWQIREAYHAYRCIDQCEAMGKMCN